MTVAAGSLNEEQFLGGYIKHKDRITIIAF